MTDRGCLSTSARYRRIRFDRLTGPSILNNTFIGSNSASLAHFASSSLISSSQHPQLLANHGACAGRREVDPPRAVASIKSSCRRLNPTRHHTPCARQAFCFLCFPDDPIPGYARGDNPNAFQVAYLCC